LFKQLYKDNHSFQISKNYFCVAGRGTWVSIVVSLPCTTSKQSTKKCITAAGLLVLQINMQLIILFSLLLFVLYASLIIYYRSGWIKIPTTIKHQTSNLKPIFISVIIPARNEEQNLRLAEWFKRPGL
jgi:hypothetical protein